MIEGQLIETVIASAAKQSSFIAAKPDCFAAELLAMTAVLHGDIA
jgi:hypothetical protein